MSEEKICEKVIDGVVYHLFSRTKIATGEFDINWFPDKPEAKDGWVVEGPLSWPT